MNRIYMVTTATACETDQYDWPNFGERSFIGWYSNYDDAYETITENICDIWEGIYTYAFIEPWDEGTYGLHPNEDINWFKWDNTLERYVSIPRPAPVEHFCGLTNLNQKEKFNWVLEDPVENKQVAAYEYLAGTRADFMKEDLTDYGKQILLGLKD